jgi:hypothetical protein
MDLRKQTVLFSLLEDAARFIDSKGRLLAKDVAELRQSFIRYPPHELVAHDEIDIGFPSVAIFRRESVGCEVSWHELDRLELRQPPYGLEHFDLVVDGEAVPALDLHGRDAIGEHAPKARKRKRYELIESGLTYGPDCPLNTSTCLGNLEIALSLTALNELVLARARKHEVRVRVDETGDDDTVPGVENELVFRSSFTIFSHPSNPVSLDPQGRAALRDVLDPHE